MTETPEKDQAPEAPKNTYLITGYTNPMGRQDAFHSFFATNMDKTPEMIQMFIHEYAARNRIVPEAVILANVILLETPREVSEAPTEPSNSAETTEPA